jgi:hypothetical protein
LTNWVRNGNYKQNLEKSGENMANSAVGAMGLTPQEFRVGKVISTTFSVYSRHIATFSIVAAIIWLPLVAVMSFAAGATKPDQAVGVVAIAAIVGFILQPISTAVILHGAFQDMRGRGVRIGDSIRWGISRFFPLLGLSILAALGIMAGMVALIIPGLILMVMWFVAVPACVVEKTGPVESLSRSSELTKGNRWKVLGALLIVGIALAIIGNIIQAVSMAAGPLVFLVALAIWQGIAQAFNAVFVVVMYHDLRVVKEGVDVERIASVFD